MAWFNIFPPFKRARCWPHLGLLPPLQYQQKNKAGKHSTGSSSEHRCVCVQCRELILTQIDNPHQIVLFFFKSEVRESLLREEVERWWLLVRDRGSPVVAGEQGLGWERKGPPCSSQSADWYLLSSPLLAQSWYTATADTLPQHRLQNPSGNCHIFVPFSTDKVQETFSGPWLPTSSTDFKHRHPRSLICYCCQHHLQISFSGVCLPSFTPLESHRLPGRQNHIHIPLLHASTDSFDADHFLMGRVIDLSYILFKASNTQLLLVKLFSLFQGK